MRQWVPLPSSEQALSLNDGAVVLFGAGLFAPSVIHSMRQNGMNPVCVMDNSADKQGQSILQVPILSPAEGYRLHSQLPVVISAAPKYIEEIRGQLVRMGWTIVLDGARWLASFEYDHTTFASGLSNLHYELDRYMDAYFATHNRQVLLVPSIDVVVTEKCSLRCRDCSNLMQYYKSPKNMDADEVISALDELMSVIDHVLEFRILGGETFVNPAAWQFVERLRSYGNFTRIAVYSNGTIVPKGKNLQCLQHENIYLRITDYGPLSRRLAELKESLEFHQVEYDIQRVEAWQECASISFRERTLDELERVYHCCCANRTFTLMHSHLYPCPFSANASNLGAVPRFPEDRLPLRSGLSRDQARSWLFDALRTRRHLSACQYCGGRDLNGSTIPSACQASAPLPYERRNQEHS